MKKALSFFLISALCLSLLLPVQLGSVGAVNGSEKPFFNSFGTENILEGSWNIENVTNVGKAFCSEAAFNAVLSENLRDYAVDFKVKTPESSLSPFSILLRNIDDSGYKFTVNKSSGSGICFGGYSESDFSDSSLTVADGIWHSVSIRLMDNRAVLLIDGVKVLDRTSASPAQAGKLIIKVNKPGVSFSGINIYNIKAEDMDAVADFDFSTDTYPAALPGNASTWSYDTQNDISGIQTSKSWITLNIKSASALQEVQELAKVTEFSMELKASMNISGSNAWQRGLQTNLPNGDNIQILKSVLRYFTGSDKKGEQGIDSIDTKLHTFDIVFSTEKIKVYVDKQLTPVLEMNHSRAQTAKLLSFYTYMSDGSILKINSLKVKTGKGVHDLIVEKPLPDFSESSESPYYTAYGRKLNLDGLWNSLSCENVGDAFCSAASNNVVLGSSVQDFGLDFKVIAPTQSVRPFDIVMRKNGEGTCDFTVNKSEDTGITFSSPGITEFNDGSLNIADNQWHSVSLRMRENRAVVLLDGVKVCDTLLSSVGSGSLELNTNMSGVYFSNLNLYNIKAEDMDAIADYDFSTDTYPNAIPGSVTWQYDTADGTKGIKTNKAWSTATIMSASKSADVQKLAEVSEFAMEIKAVMNLTTWNNGLRIYLPNNNNMNLFMSCLRYNKDDSILNEQYPSGYKIDSAVHTYDIISTNEAIKVYFDKQTVPMLEFAQNTAGTAKLLSFYTFMTNTQSIKILSLTVKNGKGVHDLQVEKPAPEMTLTSTAPYYDNFGSQCALGGSWTSYDALNVGKTFRSVSVSETVLAGSVKDFALDFFVTVPSESVNPLSVVLRGTAASAYTFGVNKTDGSGIYFCGTSEKELSDESLNIADGQWHSVSIRMKGKRAVILLDGVKILDRSLTLDAEYGKVSLLLNMSDINLSGIKMYTPSAEDMDTVANYDFSKNAYSGVLPGINWTYDTADGIGGYKTNDVEYTGRIASLSTKDEVQNVAKVKDFAMEIKFMFDINDANAWQRGFSVNLPNSHSVDLLGSVIRYDRKSDMSTQRDHDAFSKEWQTADIIYLNGLLKIYINKMRTPVYSMQTSASDVAQVLSLFTFLPNSNSSIKVALLTVKTGSGIHDPAFSPEIITTQTIIKNLCKEGWKAYSNGITATTASGYNKPYTGWSYAIARQQNFIFNFNLKFDENEDETVTIDLRYHLYDNHNEGYCLKFSPLKLIIAKYNDSDWQQSAIETLKVDFTKGADVRIVANGNDLWISIDGVRQFKLNDAMDILGSIRIAHAQKMKEGGASLTNISLLHYSDALANDGITDFKTSGPKIIADYSVTSQKQADAYFFGRFDYEKYNGKDAVKFSADGLNRENVVHSQKLTDFVLTYMINLDDCSNTNQITLNLRKGYDSTRNYGFKVNIKKDSLSLSEFAEGSFSSEKGLAEADVDIKGWTSMKIVAHGAAIGIFVNDELIILSDTTQINGGFFSIGNNIMGLNNAYFSDILITEYYEGAIPKGASAKAPSPVVNKAKNSVKKVSIGNSAKATEPNNVSGINKGKGFNALKVTLFSVASAAAVAGVCLGVIYFTKKHRKRKK